MGPAGVEPTTNGLKVLNSVPLFCTLSTFFSVGKKWCASFSIVLTASKLRTLREGILTIPLIPSAIIFANTVYGGPTSIYIDDVTITESEPTPLPIELLYFRGKNDGETNILYWSSLNLIRDFKMLYAN